MNDTNNVNNAGANETTTQVNSDPVANPSVALESQATPVASVTPSADNIGNLLPPGQGSSNDSGEKKKVIIIIGIVVLLIVVIVLIVISNKDGASSSTSKKSDNKDKVSETKEDVNKRDTIYYYKVTSDGHSYVIASYTTLKNYKDLSYDEITKYSCKGTCVYGIKNDLEVDKSKLYIADDDKLYQYDQTNNEFNELSFDREFSGKNVNFKISDSMLAAYNNESVIVTEDDLSLTSFKDVEVNGVKTTVMEDVYANRETLKDDIYIIESRYDEYQVFNFYVKDNKIAEIKENDGPYISKIRYDGSFIILDGGSKNHLIVSKNGNVQKVTKGDKYSLYDNKLVVANDSGNVEVYDAERLVSTSEASSSRIAGRGYAVMIKDNKLLIYDVIANKLLYDFGSVSSTEKFLDNKYTTSVNYSDYSESNQIITIFLEDTSKPKDGDKVFGRYFSYDLSNNKGNIDNDYYKIVVEN